MSSPRDLEGQNDLDMEVLPRAKSPVSVAAPLEPLLDSEEAAAIMRIHPKTLQKMARKGVVRGVHVGKLWRFRVSEIEAWIQRELAS
jgi:excisionase family DNA binding protein